MNRLRTVPALVLALLGIPIALAVVLRLVFMFGIPREFWPGEPLRLTLLAVFLAMGTVILWWTNWTRQRRLLATVLYVVLMGGCLAVIEGIVALFSGDSL
jgi:hypothetical protein